MKRRLSAVLKSLGACEDAWRWAVPYRTNWKKALAECPYNGWLFWLAGELLTGEYITYPPLVLCACAYAREALAHAPGLNAGGLAAVEMTERWLRGEASGDDVDAARRGVSRLASDMRLDGGHNPSEWLRSAIASTHAAAYAANAATCHRSETEVNLERCLEHATRALARQIRHRLLDITKRELGAALIEGLTRYAATLEKP